MNVFYQGTLVKSYFVGVESNLVRIPGGYSAIDIKRKKVGMKGNAYLIFHLTQSSPSREDITYIPVKLFSLNYRM